MKRLTDKNDWSGDYVTDDVARHLGGVEEFYRTNKNIRELWDDVVLPILRGRNARTAVEIGSAPGYNLVELAKGLGITPLGIEYTDEGARMNRELFIRCGYDPDNVFCEDFFSSSLNSLLGTFDIALSFGFVEHFDDPVAVIKRQIEFCRTGGYVVIVIPNIQGIYYLWSKLFNPRVIATHNISMMKDNVFFTMCEGIDSLKIDFAGRVGAFEYGLLTHDGAFVARAGISTLRRLAPAIRWLDRLVLAPIGVGNPPYMVVVGRKTG